jgi:hypothetical protein
LSQLHDGRASAKDIRSLTFIPGSIDGIIDKRVMAAVEQERRRRAEEESTEAGSHVDNTRKPD